MASGFDIKAIISAVDATGPGIRSAQKSLNDLSSLARRAGAILAGAFSAGQLGSLVDEYAGLQARLRLASRSAEEFAAANEAVQRAGQDRCQDCPQFTRGRGLFLLFHVSSS